MLKQVKSGQYEWPNMEEDEVEFSEPLKNFCEQLMAFDESERPSAAKALDHPWLVAMTDGKKQSGR